MDLLAELRTANISWTLEPGIGFIHPTSKHKRPTLHLTVRFPEGDPLEKHFSASIESNYNVPHLLVAVIRNDPRVAEVMGRWFASHGNVPVKLVDGIVEHKSFPEAVHTALRKLAFSKQSCITWNALHVLHPQDRSDFWQAVEDSILKAFATRAGKKLPTRRQVAKSLQEEVIEFLDCRHNQELRVKNRKVERTPEERYAILSFSAACELTDFDEWMYGWLGYVLEDIEDEPSGLDESNAAEASA